MSGTLLGWTALLLTLALFWSIARRRSTPALVPTLPRRRARRPQLEPEPPVVAPAPVEEPPRERLTLTITRFEIDALDVGPALRHLEGWARTPSAALENRGRVHFSVRGYAGGPGALCRIDAVRDYFSGLAQAFPAWFFFADPGGDALPTLALCTCRTRGGGSADATVHLDDLRPFMTAHLTALRQYGEELRLTHDETERMGQAALHALSHVVTRTR
jgi:hypothetical protein